MTSHRDPQVAECEARGGEWFDWGPGAPHGCSLDYPEEYAKVQELEALVAERDECMAQGGSWFVNPSGRFCEIDGETLVIADYYAETAEEPAPETDPSAELAETEPAPASQGARQYTG